MTGLIRNMPQPSYPKAYLTTELTVVLLLTGVSTVFRNIISIILFMSPVPTFVQICKKGSVEQYSAAPYLATLINCGLWVLYGLPMVHPHSLLVITINGSGLVIELVYLLLFLTYTDRKETESATDNTGVAMLGNVMMYASPLSVMRMVISTKSVEYMPLILSLFVFLSCANGICWTTYALIRFDPFLAAPNGLGTLFGLAQLILYATFYKSTKKQMLEKQGKGIEMGLAEPTNSGEEAEKISTAASEIHRT
ncbi:hypothetical protein TEA_002140 [Camellia sinensis var. sinensis]|uniref:Bidirectional sugar transporter SWEET n=1 Tax=Camellia sinensis var. sinensis TaxID=542762 RepID=A0A4V3WMH3_CAMSN|nr:hypothetical protein TEA_002140 [Camellia sinensis var. sinensis]